MSYLKNSNHPFRMKDIVLEPSYDPDACCGGDCEDELGYCCNGEPLYCCHNVPSAHPYHFAHTLVTAGTVAVVAGLTALIFHSKHH